MSDADNNRRENKMKTVRIKIYQFEELSEESQKKALTQFLDVNTQDAWWDFMYDDAKDIGLIITSFDLDHGTIDGKLINSLTESCDLIIANHGETTETYKTAKAYMEEWDKLVREHSDGIDTSRVSEENEYEFDKYADELENQYRLSILEDYRILLGKEYDYLTSTDAIKETIISNKYEFTADGKQFYQKSI